MGIGMTGWAMVMLGGLVGTVARVATGLALPSPWGTFAVNMLGAFAIGVIAALAYAKPALITPDLRLLLASGFCGAFTTFSTFGLETLGMIHGGRWAQAAAYMAASNGLGLGFAGLGYWVGGRV